MFDVPVDAWYVWLGVAAVSVAAFGVVLGLPHAAPPDATTVARAVDAVAVGPTGSRGTHALAAQRIHLGSFRIGLAGPGGRAHATFAYPVVPALGDDQLERVVGGKSPETTFDSSERFLEAIRTAQRRKPQWRTAPDHLTIRRVAWGDANATIVG